MTRTANPALNAKTFEGFAPPAIGAGAMSIQGTVNKTGILLFLVLLSASYTWKLTFASDGAAYPYILIGLIGGLIFGFITAFKPHWAVVTAPIYCLLEGLMLGGISAFFEAMYPGIAFQAVALTFGTLFGLLMAYKSGLIRATENFKLGVVAATGGIFLVYMVNMVMGMFGARIPYIHESGTMGILFSLFVVVVAALNLVLDFDFIESGAQRGAPKHMEWYAAFGLMVTLIWLYIEILHLLSKLRSR